MKKIKVNKTFFLNATTPLEIFDIILAFEQKKSVDPNSIPMYVLKVANISFADKLCDILNLAFKTGFTPTCANLQKLFLYSRKITLFSAKISGPFFLLHVYSKNV